MRAKYYVLLAILFIVVAAVSGCFLLDKDQEDLEVIVVDPVDEFAEELLLTEQQAEQLISGTGVLALTQEQVEVIRGPLEEFLDESKDEEWLGEKVWNEIKEIYQLVLDIHEIDLDRVKTVIIDIQECLVQESALEVASILKKISDDCVIANESQDVSYQTTSVTTVYTPIGCDRGDKNFYNQPYIDDSFSQAWASSLAAANPISGAVGVHCQSVFLFGSANAYSMQRVLISVPHDYVNMEIKATVEYMVACFLQ